MLKFDENTNKHIQGFVNQVAKRTDNRYMLEGNVPPHITVSAKERGHCKLKFTMSPF